MAAPLPPPEVRFAKNINRLAESVLGVIGRLLKQNGFGGLNLQDIVETQLKKFNDANQVRSLNTFIYHSYDHWEAILRKDSSFFIHHSDSLLGPEYKEMAYPFVHIFKEKLLTPGEEIGIWDIIHNSIKSALRYILDQIKMGNTSVSNVYFDLKDSTGQIKERKHKQIDPQHWAQKFGMKI
jgi:hypothetical protein